MNKNKRNKYVLIITMHADPAMPPGYDEWGGTHTYMKELMDSFQGRKIHCIVITRQSMPLPDIEQYNEYCIIYRLQNGEVAPMDKTLLKNFHQENLCKIQTIINKHGKPTVIHSVYWNSGRLAIELSENNGVRFVHSVISNSKGRVARGAIEPLPERAIYEQQIYEKASCILCVSEDEKQDIIRLYGIDSTKICVAGQYIDETFLLPAHDFNGFPRLNSKINPQLQEQISHIHNKAYTIDTKDSYWTQKVFTYMGRICIYKGIDYILFAWHKLYVKYGDLCPAIWIAGGSIPEISKIRDEIQKQIPELSTIEKRGKLVWWGYLDTVGLSTILLKSHVLLAHSRYEPGGRVVVEAMSEGVPVIATPNGFAKDYIQNWRNGFLVDYANVDELFLRLEHFIRQPFLSNALGLNARDDAKQIIKQWNFLDNHLIAYGLNSQNSPVIREEITYDYFKMRNMHLFPYYNLPLSENYIKNLFEETTGEPAIDFKSGVDSDYTSHIYRVNGATKRLIFKHVYTRLAITPLFNPFGKDNYIRRADRHFELELNIYQRFDSNVMVGFDNTHQLLILRELSSPHFVSTPSFLNQCIDYLMNKKEIATSTELDCFYQIVNGNMDNYEAIEDIFNKLEDTLPAFYFEVSGLFYGKLGWKIAPYLLEYNRHYLTEILYKRLNEIVLFFNKITNQCKRQELCLINTDTELKHFMLNGDCIEMIDFERCSIGYKENEIACLLYDYLLSNEIVFEKNKIEQLLSYIPSELNLKTVLIDMSYRIFYDMQVQVVMRDQSIIKLNSWLEILFSIIKERE